MLKYPHLTAWLIVLIGFITFWLMVAIAILGLRWFVFSSPVALTARLSVSQGSVNLFLPSGEVGILDTQIVQPQTKIQVGSNAQGVLSFIDPYSDQSIADFTLTAGTQLTLISATRPRFELSRLNYAITLSNAQGQLIVAAPAQTRAFRAEIETSAGVAMLNDYGHYTISTGQNVSTQSQELHVFNQGGDASIALPSGDTQKVWPNTIGNIARDQNIWWQSPSPYVLLASGLFEGQAVDKTAPLPNGWQCQVAPNGPNTIEPPGQWSRTASFENGALHFWRVGQNLSHGDTTCSIYPAGPDNWLDVSRYTSLRLHVRFKLIAHDPVVPGAAVQDLPVCGVVASECPVMLEIEASGDPTDPSPVYQPWHHGFYALGDSTSPTSCDTCRVVHDQINPDIWYFYDSGDLGAQFLNSFPYIKRISVYASGHQYDVAIGEVSLIGIPGSGSVALYNSAP